MLLLINFHNSEISFQDGEHVSKTNVDIRVGDVQNSPPVFSNESFAGEVLENVPIGSVVLRVEAKDGDFAQPRSIYYDLLSSEYSVLEKMIGRFLIS